MFSHVYNFRKLKTRNAQNQINVRSNIYDGCDCPNNKNQQQVIVGLPAAEGKNVHFRLVDAIESLYFTNGLKKVINL